MKKTSLSSNNIIMNQSRLNEIENELKNDFKKFWLLQPWEDYAKDCYKLKSEIQESIINSSGVEKEYFVLKLQALFNVCKNELQYMENKVLNTPKSEYNLLFKNEYLTTLNKVNLINDLSKAKIILKELNSLINSFNDLTSISWRYVSCCLVVSAIHEIFGKDID
jgi:hypothetical protein